MQIQSIDKQQSFGMKLNYEKNLKNMIRNQELTTRAMESLGSAEKRFAKLKPFDKEYTLGLILHKGQQSTIVLKSVKKNLFGKDVPVTAKVKVPEPRPWNDCSAVIERDSFSDILVDMAKN